MNAVTKYPVDILNVKIEGKNKNDEILTPSTCDINDLIAVLSIVKSLFPSVNDRAIVTYEMKHGSLIHEFTTEANTVLKIAGMLSLIASTGNLNGIDNKIIKPIESLQKIAKRHNYELSLSTSNMPNLLKITKFTNYAIMHEIWVDVEMYFYGTIEDLGGASSPNIHLKTKDYGIIVISTPRSELAAFTENLLYKTVGIRAIVKQNMINFAIDKSKIKFCSLEKYNTEYDNDYISNLLNNRSGWDTIENTEQWLKGFRSQDNE